MADVNGDGWLDIYVCNSGDLAGDNKQNELFINKGQFVDLEDGLKGVTFIEEAQEYGIADKGYGTHGVFFDYDKDEDLDLYLLNNSYRSIFDFNLTIVCLKSLFSTFLISSLYNSSSTEVLYIFFNVIFETI